MFRSVVASALVVVALFAATGCGASATPAPTTAAAKHDASWYPGEETEFAFGGDGAERAARPETAHNLEQPNRNEIPRGVIHAASN